MSKLFILYVRPKLEFNTPIWPPIKKKDINKIESIQRKFARLLCNRCSIPNISYQEKLTKLGLTSLGYRR